MTPAFLQMIVQYAKSSKECKPQIAQFNDP
jgi:hypothetical protein